MNGFLPGGPGGPGGPGIGLTSSSRCRTQSMRPFTHRRWYLMDDLKKKYHPLKQENSARSRGDYLYGGAFAPVPVSVFVSVLYVHTREVVVCASAICNSTFSEACLLSMINKNIPPRQIEKSQPRDKQQEIKEMQMRCADFFCWASLSAKRCFLQPS